MFQVVILSEDCRSRSERQPQSKDPYHSGAVISANGNSHRERGRRSRRTPCVSADRVCSV